MWQSYLMLVQLGLIVPCLCTSSLLTTIPGARWDWKIPHCSDTVALLIFVCIFDNATYAQLISIPPRCSIRFARSCSFVVCLSLFSSLARTNIFVRILFGVSLHVSTFPLPWSETTGEEREKRGSGREQINCIISAYKLNPPHKCSPSHCIFLFFLQREKQTVKNEDKIARRLYQKRGKKIIKWSEGDGETTSVQRLAWVRIERWWFVREGEGDREQELTKKGILCPVRDQWSGVFNLTWWTSYWKHHPPGTSLTTPTPFLTDRKLRDGAVFKVI